MRSSRRAQRTGASFVAVLAATLAWGARAEAQQAAQGFASERLYQAAPGGGWVVMDDLTMHGGLGGALALTSGYALGPLRVTDGTQHVAVVEHQAFTDFGAAVTYDRWRLYLNLTMPVFTKGQDGTVGAYAFTAPFIDLGNHPDTITDARIGFDGRLIGDAKSPFRLGAGAQLLIPNGTRADYDSDGTFRAMARVLFAGDVGMLTYAGQLGVHVRPLDDSPTPASPRGSEALFGIAAGARVAVGSGGHTVVVVGPEVYGETAFRSFLSSTATGVEGLVSGRIEGTGNDGPQVRVKLGTGGGLNPRFGAPEWRVVFGIELFDHSADRDHDGVLDSHDACPDVPGIKTPDPKTNGCPADRDGDAVPDAVDACPDVHGEPTTDPRTTGCPAPAPLPIGGPPT